jgi:hypothetical protein
VNPVGGSTGDFQKCGFARQPVVGAGRRHQVSHGIELVIALERQSLESSQRDLRGDVAIGLLGLADHLDDLVHGLDQIRIGVLSLEVAGGLDPFVDPRILPAATLGFAFLEPGRNQHVVPRPWFGQLPETGQCDRASPLEPARPEASA